MEWYDPHRIEHAAAASIEAIFVLLGPSALDKRQDPISFDKLEDMVIGPVNRILGHIVDTLCMTISTPSEFLSEVLTSLTIMWGKH